MAPINPFWQNAFGANSALSGANPGPAPAGLMGDPAPTGMGLFGVAGDAPTQDARQAFIGNLLAGSGWSPQRQASSEIFGRALLAAQQARAASSEAIQKKRYMDAQIAALQGKPEGFTLGLGQQRFDAAGNPIASGPDALSDTEAQKNYRFAVSQGFKGTFVDWQKNSNALPATLQEWTAYNSLSPEDQKRFLELKRSQQTYTLGEVAGAPGAFNRQQGTFSPLATASQEAAGKGQVAGAVASSQAVGTAQGGAQFDLPRVQQNVTQAVDTIDKLIKSPGLGAITGMMSKLPVIPGTDQAAADALAKQVEGQTFLQAFQSLRGGGAITDVEGQKGTAAIARLQRAQKTEDYVAALKDARAIFQTGLERISKQAGQATSGATPTRKTYNPATGMIE